MSTTPGSLRDIFNKLCFGDSVTIRTPSPNALRSLRASLRKLKQRYNEGQGAALTGMYIREDILIRKHSDNEELTTISLGQRTPRVVYELVTPATTSPIIPTEADSTE